MKQFLIPVFLFLFVFSSSCKKDNSNPSGGSNGPNTVKLLIDGKEYIASPPQNSLTDIWIECGIDKAQNDATFYMLIMGSKTPFTIGVPFAKGPANGLGTFTFTNGSITENFSGGLDYTITTGTFNIIRSDPSLIEGTLTFNLKNGTKTKTVTGSFRITAPI